ncbi:Uncharacterised protein [Chlamydia trachomatis]|nr:Uncharacterised protein [Chlamydia trachomatis]
MEGSLTVPWQTPPSSFKALSHCATLGQTLSCVLCSSMKLEELSVGHLLCVKSKMSGIH